MTKLVSFYCDNCGGGIFYILKLDGKMFLLCKYCAFISDPEAKEAVLS